jgi:hypothetical protein
MPSTIDALIDKNPREILAHAGNPGRSCPDELLRCGRCNGVGEAVQYQAIMSVFF